MLGSSRWEENFAQCLSKDVSQYTKRAGKTFSCPWLLIHWSVNKRTSMDNFNTTYLLGFSWLGKIINVEERYCQITLKQVRIKNDTSNKPYRSTESKERKKMLHFLQENCSPQRLLKINAFRRTLEFSLAFFKQASINKGWGNTTKYAMARVKQQEFISWKARVHSSLERGVIQVMNSSELNGSIDTFLGTPCISK